MARWVLGYRGVVVVVVVVVPPLPHCCPPPSLSLLSPSRCSPFPPCEQLLAAAVGGAVVVWSWSWCGHRGRDHGCGRGVVIVVVIDDPSGILNPGKTRKNIHTGFFRAL